MTNIDSLKIDLRGVVYGSSAHALSFRVNPNQDLVIGIKKYLFGLIKTKKKIDTEWHTLYVFSNTITGHYYGFDDEFNWSPIFIHSKTDLDYYKDFLHTYGDLRKYLEKLNNEAKDDYSIKRANYLESRKNIY